MLRSVCRIGAKRQRCATTLNRRCLSSNFETKTEETEEERNGRFERHYNSQFQGGLHVQDSAPSDDSLVMQSAVDFTPVYREAPASV